MINSLSPSVTAAGGDRSSLVDQLVRRADVNHDGAVTSTEFMTFLDEHPHAGLQLMRLIASRLRNASRRQVEYGALDGIGRVCRRLVELMERYGSPVERGVVIATPLTQSEIAAWAGLSREAVVKSLHALRSLGWVSTEGRSIHVLDVHAVTARASFALD